MSTRSSRESTKPSPRRKRSSTKSSLRLPRPHLRTSSSHLTKSTTYLGKRTPLGRSWDTCIQSKEVRDAGRVGEEKLQSFGIDLAFREDLYQAICKFAETEEADRLEGEKARLLTFVQRDLRRAGHELAPDQRAALKERSQRMVELGVRFQQNIDNSDNTLLVERGDLEGLPDAYIDSLETDDESGKLKVTMAYPHIIPFMDNAARRDLRKQASFLFNTRAVDKNRPILEEVIRLRQEIADIFEVPSWAHHVLEERMAKTPARVEAFYEKPGSTVDGPGRRGRRRNGPATRS